MSQVCKCGAPKERNKRYCSVCGFEHTLRMQSAHIGKGTGSKKRKTAPVLFKQPMPDGV